MYNFIVNLFTEDEYDGLLEEDSVTSRDRKSKVLVVPPNTESEPFVIELSNLEEEIDENPIFEGYQSISRFMVL